MYREKLYVVNPQNDIITDSISVPLGGNSMIVDKMGKVWLLCSGSSSQTGALCQVDVSSNSVIHNYPFNLGTNPIKLTTNASKDTLYWINDNVYRMAISDVLVPVSPFISLTGVNLYGLGVDPYTNEIYLSDAIDYVQKGMVYRYHSNGVLKHTFRVGVIPGDFFFK